MAEAGVEDSVFHRFFCHKCSVEIPRVLPLLNQRLGEELNEFLIGVSGGGGNEERRVLRGRDRDGSDLRRPGRYGVAPRARTLRNRIVRGRHPSQMVPIENLIQDFIENLTGAGWGSLAGGRGGTPPVFFLGNPGDYAWGREGLDAIVTQLLNQMDGTGPPPLAKDKIKQIPVVLITQDQIGKSLQCSVCWEDFRLEEPVRKLPCEHVYHENCIIPWLELHGTCPICRKSLGGDEAAEDHRSDMERNLAALFSAQTSDSSRASSTSSSSSSASGSTAGSSSSSSQSSHPSSNFNMDLEFD